MAAKVHSNLIPAMFSTERLIKKATRAVPTPTINDSAHFIIAYRSFLSGIRLA